MPVSISDMGKALVALEQELASSSSRVEECRAAIKKLTAKIEEELRLQESLALAVSAIAEKRADSIKNYLV